MSASVMGMVSSHPVSVPPLVTCFCPWSAWSRHMIRSEEAVSLSFQRRLQGSDCGHCGFTIFTVPAVGLRAGLAS